MPVGSNDNNNPIPNNRLLINVKELGVMVDASPRTIWRWVAADEFIQPVKIGGSTRWRLDEVVEWVNARCPKPESGQNEDGGSNRWRPSAN